MAHHKKKTTPQNASQTTAAAASQQQPQQQPTKQQQQQQTAKKKQANAAAVASSSSQQQQQQRASKGSNNDSVSSNSRNNSSNGSNNNGNASKKKASLVQQTKQAVVTSSPPQQQQQQPSRARVLLHLVELLVCAAGICICFGLWALKQERVVTKPYHTGTSLSKGEKLPTVFGLSLLQACAGFVVACALLLLHAVWRSLLRCCGGLRRRHRRDAHAAAATTRPPPRFGLRDAWQVTSMGFTNVFGSTLGYLAMRQLSFPVVLATKMSKMLPVMFVGVVWYGTRYPARKLLACLLITAGVVSFYLLEEATHPHHARDAHTPSATAAAAAAAATQGKLQDTLSAWMATASARRGWIGFALLFVNLLMDGFTNATQDELVRRRGWGGNVLMAWTSAVSALWVLAMMLFVEYGNVAHVAPSALQRVHAWASGVPALAPVLAKLQPWLQPLLHRAAAAVARHGSHTGTTAAAAAASAVSQAMPLPVRALGKDVMALIAFLQRHPAALYDVALMSVLHALGQFFVFRTIALFGSLTLTAITLLRKMGSVLLSIRVHHHVVNAPQWCALAAVAVGVVCDTWLNVHASARGRNEGKASAAVSHHSRKVAARLAHSGAKNPAQMAELLHSKKQ